MAKQKLKKLNDYQLLIRARNLIRKGWTRGSYVRHNPQGEAFYCAVGALRQVGADKGRIHKYLFDATGVETSILYYNDHYCDSQNAAVAWFQRAIRLAAKKEGLKVRC